MPDKHLPRAAVEEITGLSRTSIYRLMDRGEFPRPTRVTNKAVRWPESVITAWLAERAKVSARGLDMQTLKTATPAARPGAGGSKAFTKATTLSSFVSHGQRDLASLLVWDRGSNSIERPGGVAA